MLRISSRRSIDLELENLMLVRRRIYKLIHELRILYTKITVALFAEIDMHILAFMRLKVSRIITPLLEKNNLERAIL